MNSKYKYISIKKQIKMQIKIKLTQQLTIIINVRNKINK